MTTPQPANDAGADQLHSGRRTLAVLEALAAQPAGVTPKALSQTLGLHLSTCYRLLNTLQAAGYVTRTADGLFTLGRRVAYLNHRYETAIRPRPEMLAFLHALQLATGETAMLMRLEGDDVVIAAGVQGSRPGAHPAEYAGLAGPAYAFAAGRALLAWLPEPQQNAAIAHAARAPRAAWFPAITPDALRAELGTIRQLGYAMDLGNGDGAVCCLAAPARPRRAEPCAVAVIAPCNRLHRERAQALPVLLEVTRAIGALLDTLPPPVAGDPDIVTQGAIEAALAAVADAMSRVT
ncbi:MAG: IclR family transcriptional regulator [Thermomicrobiales bacterium]